MKKIKSSLTSEEWFTLISEAFGTHADPEKAVQMSRYMRNQFPFFGIQKPLRERIQIQLTEIHGIPSYEVIEELVPLLWSAPEREFQLAAMEFFGFHSGNLPKRAIVLIERLITSRSWWDTVDFLSPKLAASWFKTFPDEADDITSRWIAADNIWLNRSAILYQLGYKAKTNAPRLFQLIRKRASSNEFFVQKAIGWALRQYARTAPDDVLSFVNTTKLAPLSRREALKHILK